MAVHVLAVLAYREGDPVTSARLAASVNTNPVIIRRLLLSLQKARLVETRKGAGAGSRLSRSPGRINLGEVYRAVEDVEPFATPARKAKGKGERAGKAGLGLYFCRMTVERWGGTIGCENRPTVGARFWFRLPCPERHSK